MTLPGHAYWLEVPNEPTDHLWIVLTDDDPGQDVVAVMLTDIRNLQSPAIQIPAGTALTTTFTATKESTVNFARSKRIPYDLFLRLQALPQIKPEGECLNPWLTDIRRALLASADTPKEVKDFCRAFGW